MVAAVGGYRKSVVRRTLPSSGAPDGAVVSPADPGEVARSIDRQVIQLFALVEEAVAGATHALLTGDREAARALVANDVALDALYREIEDRVHGQVMAGGLSTNRTRWLLAVLSMLPELRAERRPRRARGAAGDAQPAL